MSTSAFDIQNSAFKTVPQIRFKGFDGEWKEEPILSRITNVIDFRGRTPKKLGLDWSPSGYLALSALNVKDGYIDRKADAHFGDDELYKKWMTGNELHCNQVLFTTEAPMGNVAQIPDTQKYILSQRTIAFVTDAARLSEDYLAILLKSPNVFGALLARSSGGTAKGVSQKSLSSIHAHLSDELTEQTKIGEYFRELDSLIGLHQRKHDKLVTLKKAMLQKMFPQPGTTTPEIRFKGFSGDWVEKKLGDLGLFYRGISYNHKNVSESGLLVLRSTNIQNARLIFDSDLQFVNVNCPEEIKLRKGDIAICMSNGSKSLVGKSALCEIEPASQTTVGAFCSIFRSTNPVTPHLLQTTTYLTYLNELLAGSSINNLKNSDLAELFFGIPMDDAEQQKIASYFRTLDELIAKHATQLKKLQQIKSACLARMFV